ncbi:MAG TPA: hypothetical protein PKE03_11195 [Bacteroidales bacterium]|nr:hypothetical protein [Bacteroidales bacterium]
MKAARAKQLISASLVLMLLLPFLQQQFRFVHEPPLTGAFTADTLPGLNQINLASWLDGSFQSSFNTVLEQHIGFRNTLVRMYNQWQYDIFRKANAEGVIIGRQAELFEEDYLKAASGLFFIGEEHWQRKALIIKRLQDTLKVSGKQLLVIFEPGKGTTLRKLAPVQYRNDVAISNYTGMRQAFESVGVEFLDFQQCFSAWNDTSGFLLFPRTGTHWSYYGAWLAADTLSRYLDNYWPGQITGLSLAELDTKREIRHPDDDIWLAMNMLTGVPAQKLAYPIIKSGPKPEKRPSILVVGDSFYFNWQSDGIMDALSDGGEFWYYNKIRWSHQGSELGLLNPDERIERALAHDIVLIMITERFHQNFAWKFDEQLYAHFFGDSTPQRQKFFNDLVAANEAFTRLYNEGRKKGMDVRQRLWMEVDYMVYLDYQQHPERYTSRDDRIAITMMAIRNTPHWLAEVEKKAHERKLPLETLIRLDAEWIVDNTPASP